MALLWLKYKPRSGSTVAANLDATVAELLPQRDHVGGRALNQIDYVHTLSVRDVWSVTIDADELIDADNWAFVQGFWKGVRWWLSLSTDDDEPSDGDDITTEFIEMTIPSGDAPIERLEGIEMLRRAAFKLTEKVGH